MIEIKVGSYWRRKNNRTDIIKITSIEMKVVWFSTIYKTFPIAWGGSLCKDSFLSRFIPLNRLEVLVLFGEVIDGD